MALGCPLAGVDTRGLGGLFSDPRVIDGLDRTHNMAHWWPVGTALLAFSREGECGQASLGREGRGGAGCWSGAHGAGAPS